MPESPSKEIDILPFFHTEPHSSVVDSACGACQMRPSFIPTRSGFLTAALAESSSQRTSIDLESAVSLLLSRMDRVKYSEYH